MSRVFVIGGINVDLVARAERHPRPGETLSATDFATHPGGKGANQAVAAARLGAPTSMIGRIGDDAFGRRQLEFLSGEGIDTAHIGVSAGVATGVALIVVSAQGENAIVVAPGANEHLETAHVSLDFSAGDVVACQFEVPLATVAAALERARQAAATTLLNPAPAQSFAPGHLALADVIIVNESELGFFARQSEPDPADPEKVAACLRTLRSRSSQTLVATLGAHGLVALVGERTVALEGHVVDVVDTTAAGDTFVGALAARLALGDPLADALGYANLAAALCVERPGAGPSIPTAAAVRDGQRTRTPGSVSV